MESPHSMWPCDARLQARGAEGTQGQHEQGAGRRAYLRGDLDLDLERRVCEPPTPSPWYSGLSLLHGGLHKHKQFRPAQGQRGETPKLHPPLNP